MELKTKIQLFILNRALFGFVPKSLTKIRVDGTGSDGLSECAEDFSEGKVQYAYLRYSIKNTNKFVYIAWLGSAVTGMLKGSFNNTVVDMANFIKVKNWKFNCNYSIRLFIEKLVAIIHDFIRNNISANVNLIINNRKEIRSTFKLTLVLKLIWTKKKLKKSSLRLLDLTTTLVPLNK